MTNLAWFASVICPRSVSPHPNFASSDVVTGPGLLGLVISGHRGDIDGAIQRLQTPLDDEERRIVGSAERAVTYGSLKEGADELVHLSLHPDTADSALRCAAALIAAVALAEIEHHADAVEALRGAAGRIEGVSSEDRLLLGALKQQEAFRALEAGVSWRPQRAEARKLLRSVRVTELSDYPTSDGARWDARTTNRNILRALKEANQDLFDAEIGFPSSVELKRLLKGASPLLASNQLNDRSGAISFISESFSEFAMSSDRTVRNLDPVDQPVWRSQMFAELIGHRSEARLRRRDLGQLRLMRSARQDVASWSEGLRLLRQSGDSKRLKLALGFVRSGGPLQALQGEVEAVISRRSLPVQLRTAELLTMEAGAQLLSRAAASTALSMTLAAMEAMPIEFDLQRELPSIHLQRLARTGAALAPVAGRADDLASTTLDLVDQIGATSDELLVRALTTAVVQTDWDEVSTRVRDRWVDWLDRADNADGWALLVNLLSPVLRKVDPDPASSGDPLTLERVAAELNSSIRGDSAPPRWIRAGAAELVETRLTDARHQAVRGVFSGYSTDAADLGVVLAHMFDLDIWRSVAEYLVDPVIPQPEKTAALVRIASRPSVVPSDVKALFAQRKNELLSASSVRSPFDPPAIEPFPAAVQVLTALEVLDPTQTLEAVAALSSAGPRERLEACRVISTVLENTDPLPEWAVSLAIQLSSDSSNNVRAQSGRNLAIAIQRSRFAVDLLDRRLVSLLAEDGILVPLLVLRGLAEGGTPLTRTIQESVAGIAERHPVFGVRVQARRLIDELSATPGT